MKLLAYAYDMHTYFLLYSAKPLVYDTIHFWYTHPPFRHSYMKCGVTHVHLDRLG